MRPRIALCLLGLLLATGASLCNRTHLSGRRRQASLPSSPVRRALSTEEAARLSLGRAAAEVVISTGWPGLSREDVARLAMAWPANTPFVSARLQ